MPMDDKPKKKEIKTDEIADRAAREQKEGLIRLTGRFLGNSEREGYYRLYFTEQLDRYLEFSKEGTLEAERFPSGKLVVWLKPGTRVVEVVSRPVSEDFLSGSIAGATSRGAQGVVRMMMATAGGGCGGSSLANCPDTQLSFTCNPRDPSPNCPYSPGPLYPTT
jgi:hypothetical protein